VAAGCTIELPALPPRCQGGSKVTERALLFGFLIGLPVITAMLALTAHGQSASLKLPNIVALGRSCRCRW
jgi:hypothetical protein